MMLSSHTPLPLGGGRDRAAERRTTIGAVPDASALVLVVDDDRAPMAAAPQTETAAATLQWLPADDPRWADADGEYAYLGTGEDGVDRWVFAVRDGMPPGEDLARAQPLRVIGGELTPVDADALVTGVGLARWLLDSAHCPRCGTRAALRSAGWARHCPACDRELFPRTDPAVIVAVTDPSRRRLLLGSHVAWGMGRFSCFAGFVEAGESLEATVRREVREEAGVLVGEMRYLGSQAWPYPRSLMLGFSAVTDTEDAVADGEEIVEVRWFDRGEIAAALAGDSDVTLPGSASIARALIEQWHRSAS